MPYRVELTDRAARDLEDIYQFVHVSSSASAAEWFNGLERAVQSLGRFPKRCPRAPEARKFRRLLRHLLYGKKPDMHRLIFEIVESRKTIFVLTVRHAARDIARSSEL